MKNLFFGLITSLVLLSCQSEAPEVITPQIVPQPLELNYNLNKHFYLNSRPILLSETESADKAMGFLHDYLKSAGWSAELHESGNAQIHFKYNGEMQGEAYALKVDHEGVTIRANTDVGFFYGVQSLVQMLPTDKQIAVLPYMALLDKPRFSWRGLHLDVGRHFYSVDFIKKYIDLMAFYKLNTFHWHLTEDQGWRIEIKKYPKLTAVGSQRKETIKEKNFNPYIGDGKLYGGFYTQDEVKEIVAYAAERHVTVVPEIEMPGHSLAALAAYPELGCGPGPYEVGTRWGVYEDIYCPSEKTFAFLEDVLKEVIDLFPGDYIHIGGDEAPKAVWKKSKLAQQVIKREGLKDEFELQSYFIKRIEKFLVSKGKKLIGWDEILEGGLAPEATVMSWRGENGGIEAAENGHDVVMSPNADMYFDHYQANPENQPLAIGGYTTLESVYHYEPIPAALDSEHHKHVLGAQANVWTEYMKTSDYVEYMAYPRVVALAETVWTDPAKKDWARFQEKMQQQYKLLDARGVNYFNAATDTVKVAPNE
ncbi:beta-N-acetylhexosaminidase [Roseivirga misakiensis]|nr:beta-N-acetylhexosaminidase [Roseivirga misakiensis]